MQKQTQDVPHAQRLTTSGTFVHGNQRASTSMFGRSSTSHGCVGLHDAKGWATARWRVTSPTSARRHDGKEGSALT